MFFSGHVGYYRCKECGAEFTNVTPSSILPMVCTVVLSATFWNALVYRYVPSKWVSVPAGVLLAVLSLYSTWLLLEYLITGSMKRCLKCRGALEVTGGGFYDGLLPNPWELGIYLICVAVPFCAMKWIANS